MGKPRLFIAMPTYRAVHSGTTSDVVALVFRSLHDLAGEYDIVGFRLTSGTLVQQARHALVTTAMALEATHILWLDADMRFPFTTARDLLRRQKAIIGVNAPHRGPPFLPTATKDGRVAWTPITGEEPVEPAEVDTIGFGVTLTAVEVFERMPKPWFAVDYDPAEVGAYQGEDTYFCEKARQLGYFVWVDQELTQKVAHIGDVALGVSASWGARASMETDKEG